MRRPERPSAAAWSSAVERYRRAVDRYHETVGMMPDRTLRGELIHVADPLDAVLDDLEEAAARRRTYPPDRSAEVLACIHQAATLCAHAREAAHMASEASWRHEVDDLARCVDTVQLLVKKIDEIGGEVNPQP
jgi:hypothetical protein